MHLSASSTSLIDRVWIADKNTRTQRNAFLVVIGIALIALSARIQVPMYPVPMTMQSYTVLLIGMAYGWRLGGLTLVSYITAGLLGLPVFANGGGLAYLAGPTTGYLFGFLAAALSVGWLAEKGWGRSITKSFIAALIGSIIIFAVGVSWLGQFVGFEKAMAVGVIPFLAGGLVKAAMVALTLPAAWKLLK
jgi:biotin transport system substrate-specific component